MLRVTPNPNNSRKRGISIVPDGRNVRPRHEMERPRGPPVPPPPDTQPPRNLLGHLQPHMMPPHAYYSRGPQQPDRHSDRHSDRHYVPPPPPPPRDWRPPEDRHRGDRDRYERDRVEEDRRREEDRHNRPRPPRRSRAEPRPISFKGAAMSLVNALTPKLEYGPMDFHEFYAIVREKNLLDREECVIFAILKLGEVGLGREYMNSIPNIRAILNSSIPTQDCWLIHRAVWEGNVDIVELMIDYGASVNRFNKYHEDPRDVVEAAVKQNVYGADQADMIKGLLEKAREEIPPPPPPLQHHDVPPPPKMPPRIQPVENNIKENNEDGDNVPRAMDPEPEGAPPPPKFPPAAAVDPEKEQGQGEMTEEEMLLAQQQIQLQMETAALQMQHYMMGIQAAANMMGGYQFPTDMQQAMEIEIMKPYQEEEDIGWVRDLKEHDKQTHCFVSMIAFEASPQEIHELFQTCGEIQFFHMPVHQAKNNGYSRVASNLGLSSGHSGRAIVKFKEREGLDNAIRMHRVAVKGRQIDVKLKKKKPKKKKQPKVDDSKSGDGKQEEKQMKKNNEVAVVTSSEKLFGKVEEEWWKDLRPVRQQTHIYVTGVAFEANASDLRKVFKKCGDLHRIHMFMLNESALDDEVKEKKVSFNSVQKNLKLGGGHSGVAIVQFRSSAGALTGLKLDAYMIKGRRIFVGKSRKEAKIKKKQHKLDPQEKMKIEAAKKRALEQQASLNGGVFSAGVVGADAIANNATAGVVSAKELYTDTTTGMKEKLKKAMENEKNEAEVIGGEDDEYTQLLIQYSKRRNKNKKKQAEQKSRMLNT